MPHTHFVRSGFLMLWPTDGGGFENAAYPLREKWVLDAMARQTAQRSEIPLMPIIVLLVVKRLALRSAISAGVQHDFVRFCCYCPKLLQLFLEHVLLPDTL